MSRLEYAIQVAAIYVAAAVLAIAVLKNLAEFGTVLP